MTHDNKANLNDVFDEDKYCKKSTTVLVYNRRCDSPQRHLPTVEPQPPWNISIQHLRGGGSTATPESPPTSHLTHPGTRLDPRGGWS